MAWEKDGREKLIDFFVGVLGGNFKVRQFSL